MHVIVMYRRKVEWFADAESVKQEDPGRVIIDNEAGIKADKVLIIPF